ncbi:magnesium transporter CorA family protein [Sabulicella glaciei]|uniref:Magnesium transporter CorA family protein n=1 Tax=Sabulicella glaciei TaxID=2984948 RepID=A0ABT3P092_9PROT|nr:magnesium transporter CorA family protein [Roseococcus sp. MDT2-1-1]MCW8087593.1 magnesium transporter CorA family protein [Roseococcus sp. MDT2-1-1]
MIKFFAPGEDGLQQSDVATQNVVWIDLHAPTPEEETLAEQIAGVDVPSRSEMAEIEETARLYKDGEALYMTAVIVTGASGSRPPVSADVTFVLTRRHLVTIRYADPSPFRKFAAHCAMQPGQCGTSELILLSLLETVVARVADILETGDTTLDELSAALFQNGDVEQASLKPAAWRPSPSAGGPPNLKAVLRKIGRVGALEAKLRQSLLTVSRLVGFFRQSDPGKGLALEHLARLVEIERDIRSLSEHSAQQSASVSFLLEATLGMIDIEQNEIIKVFSIAAVLFLPPTLVGTVYGMNFDNMPELHWTFGYPFALLLMVASTVVPYVWLKRRGWL